MEHFVKPDMHNLANRLRLLAPNIVEIRRISGTPGLSLGILHQNEILHIENFRYQDM